MTTCVDENKIEWPYLEAFCSIISSGRKVVTLEEKSPPQDSTRDGCLFVRTDLVTYRVNSHFPQLKAVTLRSGFVTLGLGAPFLFSPCSPVAHNQTAFSPSQIYHSPVG